MKVLAVDPGSHKCGVAVASSERCLELAVVSREELVGRVRQWIDHWGVDQLLVGGGTGSKPVVAELRNNLQFEIVVVNEFRTTERARQRYFVDHPPRGLWRLVPLGLQTPPVPIDDYAALVMAEDFLRERSAHA